MSGKPSSRSFGDLIDHAQTRIREWIAPLDQVAALIPDCAPVLELGCGQGILIRKIAARQPRVIGVDYDPRKCRMAREGLCRDLPGVTIVQQEILAYLASLSDDSIGCVVLADTLASNPPAGQEQILAASLRVLAPNGTLLLKIMDVEPRWKFWISLQVSNLVYKVLRLSVSSNQQLYHLGSRYYSVQLAAWGCQVEVIPLHAIHFNPFSHCVVRARKG